MQFFCDLIFAGRNVSKPYADIRRNLVGNIIQQHGQALVLNLIHSSIFTLHSYMLADVANVFLELISSDRPATQNWVVQAVDALPQRQNGIITATPQQLHDFQAVFAK